MKTYQRSRLFLPVLTLFFLNGATAFSQDDYVEEPVFPSIRLGFHSHANTYRQLLIGFMDGVCTDGLDYGYDSVNIFDLANDMYFWVSNSEVFIQGVGSFNENSVYPLGVQSSGSGLATVQLEEILNFDSAQPVFLYDNQTNTYVNLKNGPFVATIPNGTFNDRLSLRFTINTALSAEQQLTQATQVAYANRLLQIENTNAAKVISQVSLYNMAGQAAGKWYTENLNQNRIGLAVPDLSSGLYVVKVQTLSGETATHKIVIP